ncbi:MAG: preprotein translocase SecF subunit [Myxococcota bacterium]|jgi:preprotein translocase SecF subunit
MREIIKPGTTYPFVEMSKKFLFISAMLVVASVLLVLTKGLNKGIDFKGGNKLIVAFQESVTVDATALKATVAELIESKGVPAGQIEVQSFDVGDTDSDGNKVVKFQIYSELTTLVSPEAAESLKSKVEAMLTVDSMERPPETDKFILVLKEPALVAATKDQLLTLLKSLGYAKAVVVSEEERGLDMEFYKEYNLTVSERLKEGKDVPESDFDNAVAAHEDKKRKLLGTRTDTTFTLSLQQIQSEVEAALIAKFGSGNVEVESATAVSPSVGADLFNKGMLAMIYAIIGILIYIGLRFDFRYSPGAVAALIHDTAITLGIFSLFGIKFTLPIISALLTIIGYSLNDTIVVYDRIRENITRFKGMDLSKLVNQSINETLSRTLLTSITTLFVVMSLLVLGGGLIRDFALALTIGVIIGTYSSVFVASPLVIMIDQKMEERRARATRSPGQAAA